MASGGVGLISPTAGMTSPPRRCQHFIERQQRHCTSIVQQSDQIYCSLHLPEALQVARERSVHAAAAHGKGAASSSTGARGRYRRLESQHLATRADGTAVIEPLQSLLTSVIQPQLPSSSAYSNQFWLQSLLVMM